MKAKIGIIICGLIDQKQFVTNAYVQAIKSCGGLPLILPLVKSKSIIQEYLSVCDGFLFCGGDDITPLLFNQEPSFGIGKTDIALDIFQIRLMKQILIKPKPFLAICRGMQILNVACGGTLYQDLNHVDFPVNNHMQTSISRRDVSHKVFFVSETKCQNLLGNSVYTNSFHHQAIASLGSNLIISGKTQDGIIEAIEMPSHPFAIGVQWHPEHLLETVPSIRTLFQAFIDISAHFQAS